MPRKRDAISDPLKRVCPACDAPVGKGCKATGRNGIQIPLIPRATRLVHADRIEPPKKGSHA